MKVGTILQMVLMPQDVHMFVGFFFFFAITCFNFPVFPPAHSHKKS